MDEQMRRRRSQAHWQWTLIISIGALIAVTAFAAGILAERDLFRGGAGSGTGDRLGSLTTDASVGGTGFQRLSDVATLIESEYYAWPADPTKRAALVKQLEDRAIQGMMGGLDGFSAYLVPDEQKPLSDQMSGTYEGIGVWVESPNGVLTIVSPMPGSPAEAAGLVAGDIIEAADGRPLQGITQDDALALVKGPAGTTVRLTIRRAGEANPLLIDVQRQKIPVQSVTYSKIDGTTFARIQVRLFGDKTTAELDAALKQAKADGITGIVLDLRNNGGGWVQSAQEMLGRFVPANSGAALYEDINPNDPDMLEEPIIGGGEQAYSTPLVVLVNGGTASASEIVAGALRDYGRAKLVGERTFGKGSVQRVHDFDDGSSARITFAVWLTPKKNQIQGAGLEPDLAVAAPKNGKPVGDPQLTAAVGLLGK
jgi:carboxyl-terminal processing protease